MELAEQNRGAEPRDRIRSLLSATVSAVVIAVAAVMTVVAISACGAKASQRSDHQVPDVSGQSAPDAIAALQNLGFVVKQQQKADPSIPPDRVISTDPPAGATARGGSTVEIYVSTGPEQRAVPDVANLSFDDARTRLLAAGFANVQRASQPSAPEQKDRVVATSPPANQTAPVTAVIKVYVGTGPLG
jgi:serine/threonine-protein kinase